MLCLVILSLTLNNTYLFLFSVVSPYQSSLTGVTPVTTWMRDIKETLLKG